MVDSIGITVPDQVAAKGANYYEDLATPKEKRYWDAEFLLRTEELQVSLQCASTSQSHSTVFDAGGKSPEHRQGRGTGWLMSRAPQGSP